MFIYAHERGNAYGCTYFIFFHKVELEIRLVWESDLFSYNEKDINKILSKEVGISQSLKLAIYQFIEKTNYLLYISYKELYQEG